MATPVIMPRQGQSVESCILTEWKVKPGDSVSEGDVLAVIETDKASFDLESTASGTVLELFWEADDDVPVLANVLAIGEEGENVDEFRPDNGGSPPPEPTSSSGDQLIHVNIWTPKKLSGDEEKLLSQLKNSKNFKPNPGKSEKGFFDRVRDFMS